jgi:hypothetical protein
MLRTVWAVIRDGKIELLEPVPLSEGAKVLVTMLPDEDEQQYWLQVSQPRERGQRALADIWENAEDDVYAELLQK